jgi:AAA family ATP:ADP antiporter
MYLYHLFQFYFYIFFGKATKYAIFDPTKEMTYIPLSKEAKTQGKAAIDVLGARLGKSGGALVQQLLVLLFGNILTGAPIVASLFYLVIALWIGKFNLVLR